MDDLIERAARDLLNARYAIALTGAGISTESGIPDFRGPQGVWTKNPEAERRAYQGYQKFMENPREYWKERLAAGPGALGNLSQMKPNAGHYAIAELEKIGIIKCVITQNIDALHEKAGSKNLYEFHGSFAKLRCVTCNSRFRREDFDLEALLRENQLPPRCPACRGIVKGDTVGFGEPIPGDVARFSQEEARRCDLMLICGTSATVYPFASLPVTAKGKGSKTIIIEINAEPTQLTWQNISDYIIQGKTGEILPRIVDRIRSA